MKFDGKAFALEIEEQVTYKVRNLPAQAGLVTKPKIVSVLVGSDPASALYTRLKKSAAERVGVQFEIVKLEITNNQLSIVKNTIEEIAVRTDVTGIMVQLPIPGLQGQDLQDALMMIPLNKDVDGLRYPESGVVPPVVEAVLKVIDRIDDPAKLKQGKYVVIGATGFVGSALCIELDKRGCEVIKVDSDTLEPTRTVLVGDVVISCTGKEGMVSDEMVHEGAIVIDVGAPLGDMTQKVYQKASVSVEVPGGIGPITIACLLQNAAEIYARR